VQHATRFAVLLLLSITANAAPRPYHLVLEATPAAAFPFLSPFGTVTLDVYGRGVRAETVWLNGFSRVGSSTITVENPLARMYTEVPITSVASVLGKLGGAASASLRDLQPELLPPVAGSVKGIPAARYRLLYGPTAWIDVWTTHTLAENSQLHAIVDQFVTGISPATAAVARRIPGLPIYVELNFSHYKKLPLVRMKSLTLDDKGESEALTVGSFYFKAPFLDAIWK
jgi:hypothetical protein